jgi:hypothetical protein
LHIYGFPPTAQLARQAAAEAASRRREKFNRKEIEMSEAVKTQ